MLVKYLKLFELRSRLEQLDGVLTLAYLASLDRRSLNRLEHHDFVDIHKRVDYTIRHLTTIRDQMAAWRDVTVPRKENA